MDDQREFAYLCFALAFRTSGESRILVGIQKEKVFSLRLGRLGHDRFHGLIDSMLFAGNRGYQQSPLQSRIAWPSYSDYESVGAILKPADDGEDSND